MDVSIILYSTLHSGSIYFSVIMETSLNSENPKESCSIFVLKFFLFGSFLLYSFLIELVCIIQFVICPITLFIIFELSFMDIEFDCSLILSSSTIIFFMLLDFDLWLQLRSISRKLKEIVWAFFSSLVVCVSYDNFIL